MKLFKSIFIRCLAILILSNNALPSIGQSAADIVRYAQTEVGGTARAIGAGGAFGALGADFSVLSTNPGGLAVYRGSEVVFTPGILIQNTQSSFFGTKHKEEFIKFNFQNLGLVFVNSNPNSAWRNVNFAFGSNRTATFHREYFIEGDSPGSITTSFLNDANAGLNDPFGTQLAFDTDLVFPEDPNFANCPCAIDYQPGDFTHKSLNFKSIGSIDELVFSAAVNHKDRLYLGATVGIPILNYTQETTYSEEDISDAIPFFNSLSYKRAFSATGAGINLKFGGIYRLNRTFRIGLSVHTPSVFTITETYLNSLESNITYLPGDRPTINEASSPIGTYEYGIVSPWQVIFSGVAILRKIGFVSLETSWLNYGRSRLDVDVIQFPEDVEYEISVNNSIRDDYGHVLNLRGGFEYILKEYRIRTGYAFYGSPKMEKGPGFEGPKHKISIGIGLRKPKWYVDMALVEDFQSRQQEVLADLEGLGPLLADTKIRNAIFRVSAGFKF